MNWRIAGSLVIAVLLSLPATLNDRAVAAEVQLFEVSSTYPDGVTLTTDGGFGEWSAEFEVRTGDRPADEEWYVIDISGTIELVEPSTSPGGRAYLFAATNERAAIQLKLENSSEIAEFVEWSTTDLFEGTRRGYTTGGVLKFRGRNYLQLSGVRNGTNDLTISVEEVNGLAVKSVWIAPSTRIARVDIGPPTLSLDVGVDRDDVQPGERFHVWYEISSTGLPARDLVLEAVSDGTRIASPTQVVRRPEFEGSETGGFMFDAVEAGPSQIDVLLGSANSDGVRKTIFIDVGASPRGDGWWSPARFGLASGAVGLLLLALTLITGARGRKPSNR